MKVTLSNVFWVLQHKETLEIVPSTLAVTRFACYCAGTVEFDCEISTVKKDGFRAIKVTLDYKF